MMRKRPMLAACLALVLGAGGACLAQTGRSEPGEPHESNLQLGELPPGSFDLASATGDGTFDLEEQRGERPILLLFFRGTW